MAPLRRYSGGGPCPFEYAAPAVPRSTSRLDVLVESLLDHSVIDSWGVTYADLPLGRAARRLPVDYHQPVVLHAKPLNSSLYASQAHWPGPRSHRRGPAGALPLPQMRGLPRAATQQLAAWRHTAGPVLRSDALSPLAPENRVHRRATQPRGPCHRRFRFAVLCHPPDCPLLLKCY